MARARKRHRSRSGGAIALTLAVLLVPAGQAQAAGPPVVVSSFSSQVSSSTARLNAEINANGLFTSYHFDYLTKAAYDANVAGGKDPFTGAARIPVVTDASIGSGTSPVSALQLLSNLTPNTSYRYRVGARNSATSPSYVYGPHQLFRTFAATPGPLLPDGRGWELISPIDKNGGQVDAPGTMAGGGVVQAAANGDSVTYSSATAFGEGSVGAPPASQYIADRSGANVFGWSNTNISVPLFSGSYDTETGGVPYRLFNDDLSRALLLNGKECRGDASGCPVPNPPLAGTDAPAGYQNYYLRSGGGFEALLGAGDIANLNTGPAGFALFLAGASPDLNTAVLSSCAPIAPGALDGCPADSNLYRWQAGALSLLNSTPGAELAAPAGAVSANGSRIYWVETDTGNLWLRDGATNEQVDAAAGGGGSFEVASTDGSLAYYSKAGDLHRYSATSGTSTQLSSSADVMGVLGAAAAGSNLYYLRANGLYLCAGASSAGANGCDAASKIAAGADATNYPPAIGSARVSTDGSKLLFMASMPLTDYAGNTYDNTDLLTKAPDSQVYLYETSGSKLTCVSCNPSNGRPLGPSSIPGATANGTGSLATVAYKPRNLSANGRRVFFDSADALVLTDTNNAVDAYQWEAQGEGSCTRPEGCVALISSGRDGEGARFADASADGADAFFLTEESLVKDSVGEDLDPGGADLYVARIGGGFAVGPRPIPCGGDACQLLPPQPIEPTLTTLLAGPGNPPVRYVKEGKRCRKGFVRRKGKCVRQAKRRARAHNKGRRR